MECIRRNKEETKSFYQVIRPSSLQEKDKVKTFEYHQQNIPDIDLDLMLNLALHEYKFVSFGLELGGFSFLCIFIEFNQRDFPLSIIITVQRSNIYSSRIKISSRI